MYRQVGKYMLAGDWVYIGYNDQFDQNITPAYFAQLRGQITVSVQL